MTSTKIAVAQLGARKHYQEPVLFHRWGVLETLYTDLYAGNSWPIRSLRNQQVNKYLPSAAKRFLDRYDVNLDNAKITHFPWLAYRYAEALKRAEGQNIASVYEKAGRDFCQHIINNGLGQANTIYGFNGASLDLFQYAKSHGYRCILDQTLVERTYLHLLLQEEEARWADWVSHPFKPAVSDIDLAKRERQEQDLADQIVCGSSFVKESLILRGVPSKKIFVIPLGGINTKSIISEDKPLSHQKYRQESLHILFAGSVGLRKGIPDLLHALCQLKSRIPFVCKIVGPIELSSEKVEKYSSVCSFLGKVPRSKMPELYNWADVFVLPSICEGSAMVTYEALQYGLPVITTHNAGSITQNSFGCQLVPIRNPAAIADALVNLFNQKEDNNSSCALQNYLKQNNNKAIENFKDMILHP
ncbi:glycosyltransferase family 4 protein [Nodosilinea sp. LEGE 07088]|uniref:glycosyltransferase family 4 protein n=1 Tax=Nodosilinea sp. LEGE 07088 TaxID=2777968 RepID=UPI00187FB1A5|nr:glycosyltransferase family 4 protein [Nodosilinea sp. LEGE 07088]MBE9135946.1 glycosyltransferase family 4 protein [Nodosilinea sp. LEGE 07088]